VNEEIKNSLNLENARYLLSQNFCLPICYLKELKCKIKAYYFCLPFYMGLILGLSYYGVEHG
jgi:hypothetical protein